jgi:hypothetical protein
MPAHPARNCQEVINTTPSPYRPVDVQEVRQHHARACAAICSQPLARVLLRTATGRILTQALAAIPPLCDEVDRLNALFELARQHHHDLTAAARATLTAAADGEPDPLYYLRDELRARGQLPSTNREWPW